MNIYASGTQTCVIGTEHFVSSPNVAGAFAFVPDLSVLAAGDVLEVRLYRMAIAGGTSRRSELVVFSGVQPADELTPSVFGAIMNALTDTNAIRFSLKQTHGTGRDVAWGVTRDPVVPTNPLLDDDARIDLLALESTSQTILSDVGDIPINPLLDSDGRLNNLDAAVSTRATPTNVTDAQTAIITQVDANETKLDTLLARLGAWTGSGVNTLLGAFKALLSKTASAPSDIGGTFDPATDSTEALRDRGDAAWITATGFSTLTSGDVQTAATNALNAYDPPTKAEMDAAFALLNDLDSAAVAAAALSALASYDPPTKAEMDSGFAALNDLDAAGVRTALGMASADMDAQLAALPTAAEIIDAYKAIGVDDLDMMETIRVLLWCAISNTTGLSNGYGTMTVFKRDGSSTCFTAAIDQHGNRTITIVDLS